MAKTTQPFASSADDADAKRAAGLLPEHQLGSPISCFLKTVPGMGQTLALTIILETGDIARFAGVAVKKIINPSCRVDLPAANAPTC